MATPSGHVLWFDDPDAGRLELVGGKGANLAHLTAAGFDVPRGFCVTASAYAEFLCAHRLDDAIARLLAEDDLDGAARAAVAIRALFADRAIDGELAAELTAAYGRLAPGDGPVAVRSSATAEDLPEASFAGQQDTYLNVRGAERVLEHVRGCWASLWTERAIDYRERRGYRHDQVLAAVIVQTMVAPRASGVLFTANPVNGRRDEVVINAAYGLGEAIVSGRVTPDTFVVDMRAGAIRRREVGSKSVEVIGAPDGSLVESPVDDDRAGAACLSDDQVLTLARLGERVEAHYGAAQDVEWAECDGVFQVLQCRAITTLPGAPEVDPRDHWSRGLFTEILPDAPCPIFCSVLEDALTRMLDHAFTRLAQRPPTDIPAVAVFHHQPYMNLRYIDAALRSLPEGMRTQLRDRMANPFTAHAGHGGGRPTLAELRLALAMLREARRLPREIPRVIERYYAALEPYRGLDLDRRDTPTLVRDVRYVGVDLLVPLLGTDFLLMAVLGFAQRLLDATVDRTGLPDAGTLRGTMVSGVTGNITMLTNKALWQLAQSARAEPDVARAIQESPDALVMEVLAELPGARAFRQALEEFLRLHGHRETHMDVIAPSWADDPTLVLRFVRVYLSAPEAADPAQQEREAAERRRQAAERVSSALERRPVDRLVTARVYRQALHASHALAAERDSMHYHWTTAFPVLRRIFHEIGRRLVAAGQIDEPGDGYYLPLSELERIVRDGEPAREAAARGRSAWERDRHGPWPTEIREGVEVYEERRSQPAFDAGALRGVAGSPGTATGPVRVVRSVEEFGSLRPGEVLVATITSPVWTPLFAVAAAVVTEIGGVLSHGAIVAREYGIPAVLGVADATRALSDGQVVTVDGAAGTVTLSPRAP